MATEQQNWLWTQAECERRGWVVKRVDYHVPGGRTVDLFGFLDAVAFDVKGLTIGIQFTSRDNISARVKKIRESKMGVTLFRAGWRVLVWGFDDKGRLKEVDA